MMAGHFVSKQLPTSSFGAFPHHFTTSPSLFIQRGHYQHHHHPGSQMIEFRCLSLMTSLIIVSFKRRKAMSSVIIFPTYRVLANCTFGWRSDYVIPYHTNVASTSSQTHNYLHLCPTSTFEISTLSTTIKDGWRFRSSTKDFAECFRSKEFEMDLLRCVYIQLELIPHQAELFLNFFLTCSLLWWPLDPSSILFPLHFFHPSPLHHRKLSSLSPRRERRSRQNDHKLFIGRSIGCMSRERFVDRESSDYVFQKGCWKESDVERERRKGVVRYGCFEGTYRLVALLTRTLHFVSPFFALPSLHLPCLLNNADPPTPHPYSQPTQPTTYPMHSLKNSVKKRPK